MNISSGESIITNLQAKNYNLGVCLRFQVELRNLALG